MCAFGWEAESPYVGIVGHVWGWGHENLLFAFMLRRGCLRSGTRLFVWLRNEAALKILGEYTFERMTSEYLALRSELNLPHITAVRYTASDTTIVKVLVKKAKLERELHSSVVVPFRLPADIFEQFYGRGCRIHLI